jgi:hypothetical protein
LTDFDSEADGETDLDSEGDAETEALADADALGVPYPPCG